MTSQTLRLEADPLPLSRDSAGVIRIAGTRVSLESIVVLYKQGASVQELAEAFPDSTLPDLHAAIAYYLRHRQEIKVYIEERQRKATEARERIRAEFPDVYREVTLNVTTDRPDTPSR